MLVSQFVNEGLGNSSYLVASREAGVAAVIDPERTVEPYLEAAAALGLRITHVFETHLHADFVSGSRELAARTGAEICASAGAGLEFPHRPLREGDEVRVGELVFGVMETPGHTPEHVSFTLQQEGRTQPQAIFSGGALLVGGVARTDLLAEEMTVPLTRQLYHALHDKLLALPDAVEVYPTHGAGSFCSTPTGAERTTTIGRERRQNPPLRAASEAEFVEAVLEGLPSYPAYFRRLRAVNRRGPRILGSLHTHPTRASGPSLLRLKPLPPLEVQRRQQRGALIIETRPVKAYLAGHIAGAYYVELRPAFASWLEWVVPPDRPLVFVVGEGDVDADVEEIVRQALSIGYEDLAGYLEGGVQAWQRAGLPVAQLAEMTAAQLLGQDEAVLLDVRQRHEWAQGHAPGALLIEAGELPTRAGELPRGRPIAVACEHGSRAATAMSILEGMGFGPLYHLKGDMAGWKRAGLPLTSALEPVP